MKKGIALFWLVIAALIVLGFGGNLYMRYKPSKLNAFAQCLGEKGAKFYGAFWCPHCQNQKKMFGTAAKFLPYVECSTPDGKSQLELCKAEGIEGYPTWVFADGSRMNGEIALEVLAEKTGCTLPSDEAEE